MKGQAIGVERFEELVDQDAGYRHLGPRQG